MSCTKVMLRCKEPRIGFRAEDLNVGKFSQAFGLSDTFHLENSESTAAFADAEGNFPVEDGHDDNFEVKGPAVSSSMASPSISATEFG